MDAIELLAREDEFKRLNKQLEKKTESLMREIENVMQKQDFFSEFSPSLSLPTHQKFKKHCCTPPSQPDTPIKRNFKQKPIKSIKTQSPKSLTDEFEFESKTPDDLENSDSESQNKSSDCEGLTLNKERRVSKLESQIQSKRRDSEFDSKLKSKMNEIQSKVVCDCCPNDRVSSNNGMEFLYAFVNINVKDKVLPPSFLKERVSIESVCKFLSSKIKLLQEQTDKLQNTIEKKASQCESHLTQLAELQSERMSLLNKTNSMKSGTAEMRAKYLATQKRLDEKDKLYKELRSEADKQSSELKRLRSKNASVEAKCASQEQVIDSLRQQLDICKRTEKELRESARQLSSTYTSAISRCEQETRCLRARGEKQAALLRNLRKQNALLAAEGAVCTLNEEYAGFLNQDL